MIVMTIIILLKAKTKNCVSLQIENNPNYTSYYHLCQYHWPA